MATKAARTVRKAAVLSEAKTLRQPSDTARAAGEKRLKSLLSKTPQWRSKAERASTAATCDATGYGQLARVLRNDDTSAALRKRDMIHLTRLWGYRCHIWRCGARTSRPHALLRRRKPFCRVASDALARCAGGARAGGAPSRRRRPRRFR